MFLEISQNSQENTQPATLLKKRLWHRSFPVNFVKLHRKPLVVASDSSKFLKIFCIHKKMSVLKSLFNTVRGLKACNFHKKETQTQVFSCEYHKIFKNSFFMEHLRWLLLNIVEEFLRIFYSS